MRSACAAAVSSGLAAAVAVWTGVRRGAANLPGRFVGSLFLMVWGAGFGVIPLVIAVQQVAWSGYIHGPLAVVMFLLGAALSFRGGGLSSRRGDSSPWPWTGGSTWSGFGGDWSSGSGSSGGGFSADFGGFDGGSTGGGGASGGW